MIAQTILKAGFLPIQDIELNEIVWVGIDTEYNFTEWQN